MALIEEAYNGKKRRRAATLESEGILLLSRGSNVRLAMI
jgi:hypothetical protein